jgi:hypothetical protein
VCTRRKGMAAVNLGGTVCAASLKHACPLIVSGPHAHLVCVTRHI